MAFEQKNWLNQAEDGTIPAGSLPVSAEELNRIEQGIADSLQKDGGIMTGDLFLNGAPSVENQAANKGYVDTNVLHFHGDYVAVKGSDGKYPEECYFDLPEDINFSKYIAIISTMTGTNTSHGTDVARYIAWGKSVSLSFYSGERCYAYLEKVDENWRLRFKISGSSYDFDWDFDFDLFLIPAAQSVELICKV